MIEKAERESNLPLFEKKFEDPLDVPLVTLRSEIFQDLEWGINFQLNNVHYRTGKCAKVHFDLVTLVYNASKLVIYRINVLLNQKKAV
ncbi:hypothetical protein [Metabacillus litoralis]|uniref:hypothetical protein n=1 Tax=Metabacillus litoralis TaxID=152268 RepID=UPI001CFF1D7D|nr:hypothetical protein [Metabacillus litoralis]